MRRDCRMRSENGRPTASSLMRLFRTSRSTDESCCSLTPSSLRTRRPEESRALPHSPAVSGVELLLLVCAGLAGGLAGSIAGLASLVSYPALLAVGLGPVAANVTNTVALVFSGLGSIARARGPSSRARRCGCGELAVAAVLGSAVGGGPAAAHAVGHVRADRAVADRRGLARDPGAAAGPAAERGADEHGGAGAGLVGGVFLIGIYGGYFGAAAGVMLLALLLVGTDDTLARSNALKNVVLAIANVAAALGFILLGPVHWDARRAARARAVRRRPARADRRAPLQRRRPARPDRRRRARARGQARRRRLLIVSPPATASVTSMLPRVALEYGQRSWARSTRSSAASCGRPGSLISSSTARPKRPLPSAPMSTWAVTVARRRRRPRRRRGAPSCASRWRSRRRSRRRRAARGWSPRRPWPPIASGVESSRSSLPSSVRVRPSRPAVGGGRGRGVERLHAPSMAHRNLSGTSQAAWRYCLP